MVACVLDSSIALAWVLPGEGNAATAAILNRVVADGAFVPSLWPLEVTNVLIMAERRKRLTDLQVRRTMAALSALPIAIDPFQAGRIWSDVCALARAQNLTVYDAAYLELADRTQLPLATLDKALLAAAKNTGVAVFSG